MTTRNIWRASAMMLMMLLTATTAWADNNFSNDGNNTYTIHTIAGWGVFCDLLDNGETFSGKTVNLADNISVSRMAGSEKYPFSGTFDGQGKTLTFSSSQSLTNVRFTAPFSYASGATIRNLHVAGNIYTSGQFAAGLVGQLSGKATIKNCAVSTVIHSSTNGDGTHGGILAMNSN